jgi:hypothetical protein
MKDFLLKNKAYIVGIALGAIGGFLYWRFIGCTSGGCPITSQWYNTTLYGMVLGAVLASPGSKKKNIQHVNEKEVINNNE